MIPGGREVLGPLSVGLLEEVPVQTRLGGGHQGVVLGTQPELEVAHVVGGELDPDLDALVLLVYPGDRPPTELPAPLVVPGLLLVRVSSSIFLIIVIVIIIINIVIIFIILILIILISRPSPQCVSSASAQDLHFPAVPLIEGRSPKFLEYFDW